MPLPNEQEIPLGGQTPSDTAGEFNAMVFLINQQLSKIQTATLVRVEKCTNSGGLSPVGLVDVTPLVSQTDGQGNAQPHVTIFNIPYHRLQGGANAVIVDPEPGDIGICVFASRDISKVKATKKQAVPGSGRTYSFSDGLYIGGVLNGTPTQYVQFSPSGIVIHSPSAVTISAPTVTINASTSTTITTPTFTVNGETVLNGGLVASAGIVGATVAAGAIGLSTHIHGGVTTGGDNTGSPV